MAAASLPQESLRRRGGRLLRFPEMTAATQLDFGKPLTAIFVHGFTANADYMQDLMHQFVGSGFSAIAYEYPSDRGIHHAATALREQLENYDLNQAVSRERAVLVCHSMGGLVGRSLIALEGGSRYIRKVITLGTPHDGTMRSSHVLRLLLNWGEHVSGINPNAFSPSSNSAKELIGADSPPTLLSRLQAASPGSAPVEYFSISGGLNELEFGKGPIRDKLANLYIQSKIRNPNDGLVDEESSNLAGTKFSTCAPGCSHLNSFVEYPYTNHTYLVRNQTVLMKAVAFAR